MTRQLHDINAASIDLSVQCFINWAIKINQFMKMNIHATRISPRLYICEDKIMFEFIPQKIPGLSVA